LVSPDDAARSLLIKKADRYFWGLIWSTLVLLIGAIMEEFRPLNRLVTHNVNTRTRVRTPRVGVLRSQRSYGVLAVVFVVVGIGGEGVFEYLGAKAETTVRDFDNGIAVKAEDEAGDAATSAQNAKTDAGIAHGLAQSASDIAKPAKETADRAKASADSALRDAHVVDEKAILLSRKVEDENSEIATLEAKRKDLESALVNLAVCNAPRVIRNWQAANGTTWVDPLKPFAGTSAVVFFVSDPESRRAADNITGALRAAGWMVGEPTVSSDNFEDGVLIKSYKPQWDAPRTPLGSRAHQVGDAVAALLHSYNWEANSIYGAEFNREKIPHDGIMIEVGLYPPNEFAPPPAEKYIVDSMPAREQQSNALSRAENEQRLDIRAKALGLSSKEAAEYKAKMERDREAFERKTEEVERTYQQPCRPSGLPTLP
jgi:hypothetical protein